MKKVNYLLYAFFLIFVVGGVACYLLFVDDGVPNVDETTKDTILNKIISDNLHNKINYIQLFNTIYSNLNRNFPKTWL